MKSWRLHWKAGQLFGRGDYAGAAAIYEQLTKSAPNDTWLGWMLAGCYEHQGRYEQALPLIEAHLRIGPESLLALRAAARIAVKLQQHDKAAAYVRRALALPEARIEMPGGTTALGWITAPLRMLRRVPFVRDRIRRERLEELDPVRQARDSKEWKNWAEQYLAWYEGHDRPSGDERVH